MIQLEGAAPRQLDTLRWIHAYVQEHGYAPTARELCDLLEVRSTYAVINHLRALERKGFIVRRRGSARAMAITDAGRKALS